METKPEQELIEAEPSEIVKAEPQALANSASPASMMEQFMQSDMDVEKMAKILEMQKDWEANQARKAYHVAMAEFKADPPKIVKDLTNSQYSSKYASLANITNTISAKLSEFGLSANWQQSQKENGHPEVTCIVTHKQGHFESTALSAPPDGSGSKNPIQQILSTITYLKKETLLSITGLATHDKFDDDGNGFQEPAKTIEIPKPNENEKKVIDQICTEMPHVDGMTPSPDKIGRLFYVNGDKRDYPSDPTTVIAICEWLVTSFEDSQMYDLVK